ncbi:hypothetical protein [Neobacillus muris]|uniref:hypothetical protein n=1 Tax=Neobacillus muris TaxID=2941334 RepID=UPI00203A959D|nr:hypothetical protein [Neobacillus muris]
MASKRSIWSTILSLAGVLLFISSYYIADDPAEPASYEKIVIKWFFFSSFGFMIASIYMGILGMKKKEKGLLKYTAFLVVIILIIGMAIQPILMALFGFGG